VKDHIVVEAARSEPNKVSTGFRRRCGVDLNAHRPEVIDFEINILRHFVCYNYDAKSREKGAKGLLQGQHGAQEGFSRRLSAPAGHRSGHHHSAALFTF
jgi:hypothetical protein